MKIDSRIYLVIFCCYLPIMPSIKLALRLQRKGGGTRYKRNWFYTDIIESELIITTDIKMTRKKKQGTVKCANCQNKRSEY
jgi:hypothetical protein